jgi:flagellar hook-basal body complex protein FliE
MSISINTNSAISSIPAVALPDSMASISQPHGTGDFGKVLQGTINTLETMHQDASSSIQKFLTGENDDIHTTVLATQKAEMAFDLGLQVRNKVVSAYQEIMKMQM